MPKKAKQHSTKANNQLESLQHQVAELTHALQLERADALNLRRHHEEEIASLRNTLKVNVIRELLPVIDNFDRALKHLPKKLENDDYIKGVLGIVKQFEKTLADMGIERIKTIGEPFNPHLHEAVSIEPGDGHHEIVSEELQPGYRIGENVLRHAMVRVKVS